MNKFNDPLKMTISELSENIKVKKISPVEVTKNSLDSISKKDGELNSFINVMADEALKSAKQAEIEILNGNYKGYLHGIPIGVKDLVHIKGVKTTFGSEIYKDFTPGYDAEVITRLHSEGAILIGKLNMHEWAYGPTGDKSFFGPVKNPHNSEKVTGGSSSGSGAAVAASLLYGAIGSDTGGSIRIPSSCCGIVGMKPTFGRISKHGAMSLCPTLDHLGPMTRTVKDNAIMLNALSGFDLKDPYSVQSDVEDFVRDIDTDIKGKKIGIPTSFYFDIIDPEIQKCFELSVENLKKLGARIEYIDIPGMDDLLTAQQVIFATEAFATMEKHLKDMPDRIGEELRSRSIAGMAIQANEYIKMLQIKNDAINQHQELLNKVDVIATPTLCALPTDIDQREFYMNNGIKEHVRVFARLTGPSNTTGFPAISVPAGYSSNGMPIGLQFIGRPFDEKQLYQFAFNLERTVIQQTL